ncbi:AAA family ATPase [Bradyrhizobium diazoefficiens]|uniref:AAA family ATPase n=1 Tax=Bradyrhizobium diazoefficiens TaxID=1355477 RepID=UPI0036F1E830
MMNAQSEVPTPNLNDINEHLYSLFDPAFVHSYPGAHIQYAYSHPHSGSVDEAQVCLATELKDVAKFAAKRSSLGFNVYISPALLHFDRDPPMKRVKADRYLTCAFAWVDFDRQGDAERVEALLRERDITPAFVVTTGTIPCTRAQMYFRVADIQNASQQKQINEALQRLLGTDKVSDPCHLMRLAGSVNYPTAKKSERGYVVQTTTLRKISDSPTYDADELLRRIGFDGSQLDDDPNNDGDGVGHERPHTSRSSSFSDPFSDRAFEAEPELVASALKHIPNGDLDWDDWNRVAMAAWRATKGSSVAFDAFDEWSRKSNKYDAKTTREKWTKLFRSPPSEIGAGTIFKMAADNGWVRPRAARDEDGSEADADSSAETDEAGAQSEKANADDAETGRGQGTGESGHGPGENRRKRTSEALPLTYFGEFRTTSKKRALLKGFLNKGEISALIAPPKRGKSGLMTEIAVHCAAGIDWRGHAASGPCGVVILALERGDLYQRRLDAYALRDGYKGLPIAVARKIIDLLAPECVKTIVATVREAEQHMGCTVGLVVIDTYSKGVAAGGGDENSAKDQNRIAANLRRVQELVDIHISCVGHTGKDPSKGARGSNAHLGDVDLMIQITGDAATKTAKVTDANDQPERVIAQFLLEPADTGHVDDDGEVETVAIIARQDVSSADTGEGKLSDKQQVALSELFNCIADEETAPSPNNVHVPTGVKGVTLTTWRNRLAARGIINPKGNPYQEFQRIHLKLQKLKKIEIWEDFVWPIH